MKKKNDNKVRARVVFRDGKVSTVVDGRRCVPVVNDKGEFFASSLLAGKAYDMSPSGFNKASRDGTKCAGHRWSLATLEQCREHGLDVKDAMVSKAEAEGRVVVVKKASEGAPASPEGSAKRPRRVIRDVVFQGHRWSDGAVTIRFGKATSMTRPSEEEIPPEILHATEWLEA